MSLTDELYQRYLPIDKDDEMFKVKSKCIDIYIDKKDNQILQEVIDTNLRTIDNDGNTLLYNKINIFLHPGVKYHGNLHLYHDNMVFTTASLSSSTSKTFAPAIILGTIFIQDVIGARFSNLRLINPKQRIAIRITNPLINDNIDDLITECKITECSVTGAIVVSNHGSHLQLYTSQIIDARGLPGVLIENGGEVIIHDCVSIERCKIPILAISNNKGRKKHVSTVHMFTNNLSMTNNHGPVLEDGGIVVYYVSFLEKLIFYKCKSVSPIDSSSNDNNDVKEVSTYNDTLVEFSLPPPPTVETIYNVINQMCSARDLFPTFKFRGGRGRANWSKEHFIHEIQNLKVQMKSKWTRDIGNEFGRALHHINFLLKLKGIE